ncbi:MAG: DUF2059 domain-containing protein [candidate division Zixibacteria bacterium]|nr:DUF2059 domain-containing protein [candidate division Zixibacteria bacterium]
MKKFLIAIFILAVAAGLRAQTTATKPSTPAAPAQNKPAAAKTGATKAADIKTLLSLTQAGELAVSMMQEMLNSYRQSLPKVPDEFWLKFAKKIKTEDLVEMLVPIYDRHLTHADVTSLIEFFESPVGKKLISVQPAIMKESMQVGQVWGEKLANEVTAELQKQGYR